MSLFYGLRRHSNLPDALFEFNSDALSPYAADTIGQIGKVLKGVSGRTIAVEGHTDSVGSVQYTNTSPNAAPEAFLTPCNEKEFKWKSADMVKARRLPRITLTLDERGIVGWK